ncbi:dihydrofolate reductase [Candidatus Woesearchaeota archaeon]|nr:MAG: dihydrofolate reductase [Candidatus Woesearchaeota archaeon]
MSEASSGGAGGGKKRVSIIAAMTRDRVIGKDNRLLWHIPEDLRNFKRITSGNIVIMGRKTFESIGRPLPNRTNIVISRTMPEREGVIVCRSIPEALDEAEKHEGEIFIIGGANIYEQFMPLADRLLISLVEGSYEGDAFFPEIDDKEWEPVESKRHHGFEFMIFEKRKKDSQRDTL